MNATAARENLMSKQKQQEVQHTATPWICRDNLVFASYGAGNGVLARVEGIGAGSVEQVYEKANANAEFIVKACNSHDELVEALEGMVCNRCENRIGYTGPTTQYGDWRSCSSCAAARAALSKTKGESQ